MSIPRRAGILASAAVVGLLVACQTQPQQQSQTQPQAPVQATPPAKTTSYPIYFDTTSAVIHANDLDTIRAVASLMAGNPNLSATVIGATDTTGSGDYNMRLSQRRAQAVFDALIKTNKVPESRVTMQATGEDRIPVPTANEKPELLNRTVYIVVR